MRGTRRAGGLGSHTLFLGRAVLAPLGGGEVFVGDGLLGQFGGSRVLERSAHRARLAVDECGGQLAGVTGQPATQQRRDRGRSPLERPESRDVQGLGVSLRRRESLRIARRGEATGGIGELGLRRVERACGRRVGAQLVLELLQSLGKPRACRVDAREQRLELADALAGRRRSSSRHP